MLDTSKLKGELDGISDAVVALEHLYDTLIDEVESHKGDAAEIQALVDQAREEKDEIIAFTLAHTPAAPPPVEEPPV